MSDESLHPVIAETRYWQVRLVPWACHLGTVELCPRFEGKAPVEAESQMFAVIKIMSEVILQAFELTIYDIRTRDRRILIPFHWRSLVILGRMTPPHFMRDDDDQMHLFYTANDRPRLNEDEMSVLQKFMRYELKAYLVNRWEQQSTKEALLFQTTVRPHDPLPEHSSVF